MKVRVTSQLPLVKIGSLKGKELVASSDGVGYSSYELHISPGSGKVTLNSPLGPDYNHIYYVVDGSGHISLPGCKSHEVAPHLFFALTGQMEAVLEPKSSIRLFVTYVKKATGGTQPDRPAVCRLADIIGTDRDIDWHRGRSRRFLRQDDGFNLSLHNTVCYKNNISPLVYKNNFELAYYMKGDATYKWGKDHALSHHFQQTNIADGDGCAFLMDENDSHELHALSQECEVICVFYPALKGTETHDFSKGGHSAF